MCKKRSIKNKVLYSCVVIVFMAVILFPIVGSKNVSAQWLYYPASAISLYGTPSITLPFSAYPVPFAGTLPYNLYYPAVGSVPGIPILPPLPLAPTTATAPLITSPLTSTFSFPTSVYSPINILSPLNPLTLSALLSRVALTTINPVAATSIFSLLSSIPSLIPAVAPTNVYNLYYPAVGSVPGIPILPPAATGVGTLPYNLYYPAAGSVPGIPVLPPLP